MQMYLLVVLVDGCSTACPGIDPTHLLQELVAQTALSKDPASQTTLSHNIIMFRSLVS
jgi:hypothetical protein